MNENEFKNENEYGSERENAKEAEAPVAEGAASVSEAETPEAPAENRAEDPDAAPADAIEVSAEGAEDPTAVPADAVPPTEEEIREGEKKSVGKIASRVGLFVTVLYLAWLVLARTSMEIFAYFVAPLSTAFGWSTADISSCIRLFVNVAAMFAAAMIARPLLPKTSAMPRGKFGFGRVLCALGASVVLVMITAPLGSSFHYMWDLLTGVGSGAGVESNPWAMLLFAGIATPIVEELIFRRFLLGRLRPLGEGIAIVISSAIFAVFHMNFTQLFFTFFCGLVWGWVYCRSGKFWHVCFLHIAYNTVYGLLLPYLTEWSAIAQEQIFSVNGALKPAEILPFLGNLLIISAWVRVLTVTVALAVLGVIALSRTLPKLKLEKSELSLTRKETLRAVFSASGFIAMLLVLAIYFVSRVTGTEALSLLLYR